MKEEGRRKGGRKEKEEERKKGEGEGGKEEEREGRGQEGRRRKAKQPSINYFNYLLCLLFVSL